jgi:catechol 2,3-dioxygenase-like lactoylglutathione lyase family enzyme
MKQIIRVVTVGVEDLRRSRAFYSDGLGWAPLLDLEGIVFYQVGFGLVFAIWPLADLIADVDRSIPRGSSFTLGHNVDSPEEVDQIIAHARNAGATILKEPQEAPLFGGHQAYFADPDGYLWDIVYNPGLSVTEDGTVVIGTPDQQ